jgi:hypothetical protein
MILAVLLDGDGRPVCSEMWPGNTADVTIDRLRRRFAIRNTAIRNCRVSCIDGGRGPRRIRALAQLPHGLGRLADAL